MGTTGGEEALDVQLAAGTVVKHYEMIRLLDQGGMGRVFLARAIRLGRLVALKFIRTGRGTNTQHFMAEARVTAQLN